MAPIEKLPGNERITVPSHLLSDRRGDHYVLRVVGDSMIEEAICDGDFVIVLRREVAEPGEMVIAILADQPTLKRFYPEGEMVRLQPGNPVLQPIFVAARDLKIQGIVVGLMRKY